jgi:hypothetical protein
MESFRLKEMQNCVKRYNSETNPDFTIRGSKAKKLVTDEEEM